MSLRLIILLPQSVVPPRLRCIDKLLIKTTVVPHGTTEEDITSNMFSNESGRDIRQKMLEIVLIVPPQSPVLDADVDEEFTVSETFEDCDDDFEDMVSKINSLNSKLEKLTQEWNKATQEKDKIKRKLIRHFKELKQENAELQGGVEGEESWQKNNLGRLSHPYADDRHVLSA
ncbi:hypothetical protein V6N11_054109 [Hibiscus sabdariffa]|uniref:Uncharacterized protein n=1 Tax=Hibiscus sabdariffa TaxID=183260 RepID=A0ABR2S2W0_9ROSI